MSFISRSSNCDRQITFSPFPSLHRSHSPPSSHRAHGNALVGDAQLSWDPFISIPAAILIARKSFLIAAVTIRPRRNQALSSSYYFSQHTAPLAVLPRSLVHSLCFCIARHSTRKPLPASLTSIPRTKKNTHTHTKSVGSKIDGTRENC